MKYRPKKLGLIRYLFYRQVQIEGEGFNSNKLLNLAVCTVKYGLLNLLIMAHILIERYINIIMTVLA